MIEHETQTAGGCGDAVSVAAWEEAYRRFETPAQEVRKFLKRLRWLGAAEWPRDSRIVDLFCGRGNGLVALEQLGFRQIEGVDLSPTLLAQYRGLATLHEADCRSLPFQSASRDVVTVHGGLHHLAQIPADLSEVIQDVHRVLRPDGLLAIVEPWSTPFLWVVHRACGNRHLRRAWPKLDALAVMTEHERDTYEAWLSKPREIHQSLNALFHPVRLRHRWGKLWYLGRKGP